MKIKDINATKINGGDILDIAAQTNIATPILVAYFTLKQSLKNGLTLEGLIRCIENVEVNDEIKYN